MGTFLSIKSQKICPDNAKKTKTQINFDEAKNLSFFASPIASKQVYFIKVLEKHTKHCGDKPGNEKIHIG